ncbi:site-2 protease family protein [Candidatus Dojkabacteria bacterium]|nr:site-2 protease family protein [Candidatus Dojkabacteria bacterium]
MILIDFLLTIIVLIVLFGFLVFVHELGHFLAAKIIGVEVEEFAFGFGKKLFARRYKDTLYRINAIPLGGYVKVLGDEDASSFMQVQRKDFTKEQKKKYEVKLEEIAGKNSSILSKLYKLEESQKLDQEEKAELLEYVKKALIPNDPNFILKKSFMGKLFVYTAGVIMNLFAAFFIFYLFLAVSDFKTSFYKIAEYPFVGTNVQEVEKPLVGNVYNQELKEAGFDVSEENLGFILLEIDNQQIINLEQFNSLYQASLGKEVFVKYQIIATGEIREEKLPLNTAGIDLNIDPEIEDKIIISTVNEDSPAENGGLEPKDIVLEINGVATNYTKAQDFSDSLEANAGQKINLKVLRQNGSLHDLEIQLNEKNGDQLLLGASFQLNYVPLVAQYDLDYSGNKALSGITHTINVFGYNPVALFEILSVSVEQKDPGIAGQSVTSIWGVGEHINTLVVGRDYKSLINIAGLVSVSLAFMNILPIPLLDGGQILFLVIEKIRRKPLGVKMQERISRISFFFLIGLSVLVILKDIWLGFIGEFLRSIF